MARVIRILALLNLILLLTISISSAQNTNYAGEFLSIGVGARALGMGGAFVAVADDASAAYWNPAGLTFIDNIEVTGIHLNPNELQNYDFINYAQTFEDFGTYAISYIRLGSDNIPLTTSSGPTINSYFSDSENALLLSGGLRVFKGVAVGLTVKYIFGGILDSTFSGYGVDVGVLFKPIRQLKLGVNVQDALGTSITWQNTPSQPTDVIPLNVKIGGAFTQLIKAMDSRVTLALDADTKYDLRTHGGMELWYKNTVVGRIGFINQQSIQQPQLTLGAGFIAFFLELDYSYVNYDLMPLNYFSIIARF